MVCGVLLVSGEKGERERERYPCGPPPKLSLLDCLAGANLHGKQTVCRLATSPALLHLLHIIRSLVKEETKEH